MRRQHKKYKRPKSLFGKERIEEEKNLIKSYGLKNNREIWKAEGIINKIRKTAKQLLTASSEEQEVFLKKMINLGLANNNSKLDDMLGLTKVNILERRLQTILFKKNLAHSQKHARQLITHRHILVDNKIVNAPSFLVPKEMEAQIKIKK